MIDLLEKIFINLEQEAYDDENAHEALRKAIELKTALPSQTSRIQSHVNLFATIVLR